MGYVDLYVSGKLILSGLDNCGGKVPSEVADNEEEFWILRFAL